MLENSGTGVEMGTGVNRILSQYNMTEIVDQHLCPCSTEQHQILLWEVTTEILLSYDLGGSV